MKPIKNNKRRIGLTGGIASGKSTVAKLFELLGFPVYNSDYRAKYLIENNQSVRQQIMDAFGKKAYLEDGSYNRSFISSVVFNHREKLEEINAIVHPAVFADQDEWFADLETDFGIVESALIYETNTQDKFDAMIVVIADNETRIERIMNRDEISQEQAQAKINAQIAQELKAKQADFLIENNGNRSLIEQVSGIINELR